MCRKKHGLSPYITLSRKYCIRQAHYKWNRILFAALAMLLSSFTPASINAGNDILLSEDKQIRGILKNICDYPIPEYIALFHRADKHLSGKSATYLSDIENLGYIKRMDTDLIEQAKDSRELRIINSKKEGLPYGRHVSYYKECKSGQMKYEWLIRALLDSNGFIEKTNTVPNFTNWDQEKYKLEFRMDYFQSKSDLRKAFKEIIKVGEPIGNFLAILDANRNGLGIIGDLYIKRNGASVRSGNRFIYYRDERASTYGFLKIRKMKMLLFGYEVDSNGVLTKIIAN